MTQIIVITAEGDGTVGVIQSGDLLPGEAQTLCQAASRFFGEQAIEAEVQRRIAAIGGKQVEEPEFGETVLDS